MSKPGPGDNIPPTPRGSRIYRRVESLMSLVGIMDAPESPSPLLPAPTPIIASPPAPTPVAAAATHQQSKEAKVKKESKNKKEKKEKTEQGSRIRRMSMRFMPSFLLEEEEPKAEPTSSPIIKNEKEKERKQTQENPEINTDKYYVTHDKVKIYKNDLKKYEVTVCTYAERAQALEKEALKRKEKEEEEKKRAQEGTSPRLQSLQALFAEPAPASPVRRGSVVYNAVVPPVVASNELDDLLAFVPAPAPILTRTSSMVLLTDALAALKPAKEEPPKAPRP